MDDLKELFLKILPGKIQLIENSLDNIEIDYDDSLEKVREILHSLKNTASIYGFEDLGQKAEELDEFNDEELIEALTPFLEELKRINRPEKSYDKIRVLLIENDDFVIQLVRAILPEDEYSIISVKNGNEAREVLLKENISIIISNIILPDIDGRQLLSEFEGKYNVPMIVLTDKNSEALASQSTEIGVEYYFTFPFDVEAFKNKVVSLVGSSGFTGYENVKSNIFLKVKRKYALIEDYKHLQETKEDNFKYTFAIVDIDIREDSGYGSFKRDEIIYKYITKLNEEFDSDILIAHWERLKIGIIFPGISEEKVIKQLNSFLEKVHEKGLHFDNYSDIYIPFVAGGKQFNIGIDLEEAFVQVDEIANRAKKGETDKVLCSKCGITEKKVLLAEEDEIISSLIIHRLGKLNYKVTHIENGNDVIPRLNKDRSISTLITTVNLPEMGGFEIVEKLRKSRIHSNLPIIILTPYGREHDILHALDIGVDDYLVKPFSPNELIARIQRLTK